MEELDLSLPRFEECAVQSGKQPGLDLGDVAQLMSFLCPDVKRLLGQVPRVEFHLREAQREPEQWLVMLAHNRFKLIGGIHRSSVSTLPKKIEAFIPSMGHGATPWD